MEKISTFLRYLTHKYLARSAYHSYVVFVTYDQATFISLQSQAEKNVPVILGDQKKNLYQRMNP